MYMDVHGIYLVYLIYNTEKEFDLSRDEMLPLAIGYRFGSCQHACLTIIL
jgi:hypothetical protein